MARRPTSSTSWPRSTRTRASSTGGTSSTLFDASRFAPAATGGPGRVAVLDLMRARTRRFDTVFVLGLEEGSLPRRSRSSPFLDDDVRSALGARLERPDPVSRDRYLFYTACTRPTRRLYLVRQAATDEGSPLEPSPFWQDAAAVFTPEEVERATYRRPLSSSPGRSRPHRQSASGFGRWRGSRPTSSRRRLAVALADANGWRRRLDRARVAFTRRTRLRNPAVLAQLGSRTVFGATELERFLDCSSAWLFERVVDPKTIDAEADALLRGKIAHQTLYAFYSGPPDGARGRSRHARDARPGARASSSGASTTRSARASASTSAMSRGRAAREPSPRPRAVRPIRSGVAARVPPEALRGRASAPTAPRRSCSAGRARRRALRQRQDRPDRHRPDERPRDRSGLQVGEGVVLGQADRRGAPPPGAAVHARAPRPRGHRAARRRLPPARRCRCSARDAQASPRATSSPASSRPTTSTRSSSGARSSPPGARARRRAADPQRATSRTTRRAASARHGATSGRCAG